MVMDENSPIGIFDSGVGGLSVLKELVKVLPSEEFLYFGDTLRVPYGDKSLEELIVCTKRILDFFATKNVKAVVVACNTCSANTVELLKDDYDFEILGLIKPVSEYIKTLNIHKVGLIATQATVNSKAYPKAIEPKGIKVFQQACPKLVSFVERAEVKGQKITEVLSEYLRPLLKENVEKLILGCTHYPFLIPAMVELGLPLDFFINPAVCMASYSKEFLGKNNLLKISGSGSQEFFVSGNENEFLNSSRLFFGNIDKVSRVS